MITNTDIDYQQEIHKLREEQNNQFDAIQTIQDQLHALQPYKDEFEKLRDDVQSLKGNKRKYDSQKSLTIILTLSIVVIVTVSFILLIYDAYTDPMVIKYFDTKLRSSIKESKLIYIYLAAPFMVIGHSMCSYILCLQWICSTDDFATLVMIFDISHMAAELFSGEGNIIIGSLYVAIMNAIMILLHKNTLRLYLNEHSRYKHLGILMTIINLIIYWLLTRNEITGFIFGVTALIHHNVSEPVHRLWPDVVWERFRNSMWISLVNVILALLNMMS